MTNRIVSSKSLAFALGFFSLDAIAAAQSGSAENKVLDRAAGTTNADFTDLGGRFKSLGSSTAPRFVFNRALTLAAGYANNPDQTAAHSGSYFLGSTLNLDAERADPTTDSLFAAGYEVAGTFFEHDHDTNDEIDQFLYATYQRKLAPGLEGLFSANLADVRLDYDALLTVAGVTADLRQSFGDIYTGGLSYTYQDRNARFAVVNPRRDPDANRHIPTAYFTTNLPKLTGQAGLPVVTVAYSRYWNLARGNDEDFSANRVALRAVNWTLGAQFSADLDASYEDRDGDNLNSRLAGLAARQDQITRLALTLRHAMLAIDKTQLSLQVGYERARSNIATGNYTGTTIALTGTRQF